jgi:hypothetical protein
MKKFLLMLGLVGLGIGGHTDADAQGRWTLTPSLSASERFDDNIFFTADHRTSDFVTEVTPGLLLTYEVPSLRLSAGYSIIGQVYVDSTSLDNVGDNQTGFLSASYQASPQLTLKLVAYYARTSEPETFLRPPSVPQGTTVTTLPTVASESKVVSQFTLTGSGEYQFDAATAGTASYSAAATGRNDISHTLNLGVRRQLTTVDQAGVTASGSLFDTTGTTTDTSGTTTSIALLIGWSRQWTPNLGTSVSLGPQVTDGNWNGAGNLGLKYQVQKELSVVLTFTQGTSLVVGESAPQLASTLLGAVNYQASQALGLNAFGSIQRTAPLNDISSSDATISYSIGASTTYQLTRRIAVYLQYQFTLQGTVDGGDIRDNQVTLGLTFSEPFVF